MAMDEDTLRSIWSKLCQAATISPVDVVTVRLNGRPGIWFQARASGNGILVQYSAAKKPSSNVTQERPLDEDEFVRIGLQYEGWRNKTIPRHVIRDQSQNTSYIFGIIAAFQKAAKVPGAAWIK